MTRFTVAFTLTLVLGAGCTGDIVDTVTTDYGNAVATTERAQSGDISARLTSPKSAHVLGALDWNADSGQLDGIVEDQPLSFTGTMQLADMPMEDLSLFLYNVWEIEAGQSDGASCVSNDVLMCCRDGAWSCRARYAAP